MALPSDVQVIPEVDLTRLILPVRVPSASRWVNLYPIIFGLFFSGFALFWMATASGLLEKHERPNAPALVATGPEAPLNPAPKPSPAFDWFRILFALFGVPFFVAGLVPIAIGILAFFPSHAEIAISSSDLIAIDQIGPFRLRRRRPLGQIRKLRLGQAFQRAAQTGHTVPRHHGIFAELSAPPGRPVPPPLRLAQRYPLETLTPVAEFLLAEFKRRGAAALLHADDPASREPLALAIDPEPAPAAPVLEPALPQPENSKISFIPAPDSLTFIIPRTGFRGTALFLILFALFWDGISFPAFVAMAVQLFRQPSLEHLGILGFISIFVIIGVGVLLAALQSAFRRAVILAGRDALVFTQTGPVRKSEYQWPPAQLTAIRCADSSTSVNDKPLKELQIHTKGKKRGLLTGRREDDLLWLASVLRDFYRVAS